ncbi:MAG: DNA primase [Spartobacteria bacterium]|nr:DNA primase [Spartobacteria bacterium]
MIPQETIELIRTKTDIVELIGSYVPLKRFGSTFKACCPFHKEKTPSFVVTPGREMYHCFGCGKGGNVFQFIMDYEGVDFMNAVRMLANRAGVIIDYQATSGGTGVDKALLFKIHEEAAALFARELQENPVSEPARAYLAGRGISQEIIEAFRLGYAPDQWSFLLDTMKGRGYAVKSLIECGLVIEKENERTGQGHCYDRFRQRIMIPIRDELGRIVAFTARELMGSANPGAKYINSPETPIFQKSRTLFGLSHARRQIAEKRHALLCEGQIDVIRCHASGFTQAVASQGTAITTNHAHMLRRYTDTVILVLDGDHAGIKAAIRSTEIFTESEMIVRIAMLPQGQDPDSYIRENGAEAFQQVIDASRDAVNFLIDSYLGDEAGSTPGDAAVLRASRRFCEFLASVHDPIQREQFVRTAAQRFKVTPESLMSGMQRNYHTPQAQQTTYSRRMYGRDGKKRDDRILSGRPVAHAPVPSSEVHAPEERALAELLLHVPALCEDASRYMMNVSFQTPMYRLLVDEQILQQQQRPGQSFNVTHLAPEIAKEASRILVMEPMQQSEDVALEHIMRSLLIGIKRRELEKKRAAIRARLTQELTDQERERLTEESAQLIVDINMLRRGWERAAPLFEFHLDASGGE